MSTTDVRSEPELTSPEDDLYNKVKSHCATTNTSYALKADERQTAKRLVNRAMLFYSMDYDHVRSYARH